MQCDKFIEWQLVAGRGLVDASCLINREKKADCERNPRANKRSQLRSGTRQKIYKYDAQENGQVGITTKNWKRPLCFRNRGSAVKTTVQMLLCGQASSWVNQGWLQVNNASRAIVTRSMLTFSTAVGLLYWNFHLLFFWLAPPLVCDVCCVTVKFSWVVRTRALLRKVHHNNDNVSYKAHSC